VGRLASALAQEGLEVGLWAPDGSAINARSHDSPGNARHPVTPLSGSVDDAIAAFGIPDVFHDNGIWMPHNHGIATLAAKRGIARVVSTRGMLEPWAFAHKRWKKEVAWRLYQKRDLRCAGLLHATSDVERTNLASRELDVDVTVIPNGVDIPGDITHESPGTDGNDVKTALFVGRLYPVKGLPGLIEAWGRVRPAGWKLVIAGPDEAGHLAELRRLVADNELGDVVSFPGPVAGDKKRSLFLEAELFVLPTHSESFGMAIAEALAYGVPVLTTTGAPWPLLEEFSCGWRVAPDIEALADGIVAATSLDAKVLGSMGGRGREVAIERFNWENVARRFVGEYARLV
jgi:glycosyltransferase involved in cell wall biosynthesis